MRKIYIGIAKLLAARTHAKDLDGLRQLLINLNTGQAPGRDQDLTDLFSEFYLFVTFGWNPDRGPEGIRSWEDLRERICIIERSSQQL